MKALSMVVIALLALVGVVAVRQLPEIRRYMKISSI
jgi:type II secretory pathway component PulJ